MDWPKLDWPKSATTGGGQIQESLIPGVRVQVRGGWSASNSSNGKRRGRKKPNTACQPWSHLPGSRDSVCGGLRVALARLTKHPSCGLVACGCEERRSRTPNALQERISRENAAYGSDPMGVPSTVPSGCHTSFFFFATWCYNGTHKSHACAPRVLDLTPGVHQHLIGGRYLVPRTWRTPHPQQG